MEPEELLHALVNTSIAKKLLTQAGVNDKDYTIAFLIEETIVICCRTLKQGVRISQKLPAIEYYVNHRGLHLFRLEIYLHDQGEPIKAPVRYLTHLRDQGRETNIWN
jgi:hypothetical protein